MSTNKSSWMAVFCLAAAPLLAWAGADYGNYKGKGGMEAYEIKKNVYEYHYDKGFTGPDAMGWDANLQFAWSRVGAAKTCGVAFSADKIMEQLIAQFQQDKSTHEIVGIGFHAAQSKADPEFCSAQRVEELKRLLPEFEEGKFPRRF